MQKWQIFTWIGMVAVIIIYFRAVTFQTEKIADEKKKTILRLILLGIPTLLIAGLIIFFWKHLSAFVYYMDHR